MKLIVGLGNPGRQYAGTRHNVGYDVLAQLARDYGAGRPRERFQAEVLEAVVDGQRALLISPLTYMNRSGRSVQQARDFYKVAEQDLLVICDDINLPLGRLRIRPKGSAGGQKGLQDIIRSLGSDAFSRLRIGIGAPPEGREATGYVLGRFSPDERPVIDEAVGRAAQAAADWCRHDVQYCMNHYNANQAT